jgi:uncharacterized membrane protein YuzA (DUF378 family)
MKTLNVIAVLVLIIGGLNWGLIGVFGFNFIGWVFQNDMGVFPRIIYVIVGVCALWRLFIWPGMQSHASGSPSMATK